MSVNMIVRLAGCMRSSCVELLARICPTSALGTYFVMASMPIPSFPNASEMPLISDTLDPAVVIELACRTSVMMALMARLILSRGRLICQKEVNSQRNTLLHSLGTL
eukprot:TRINITY_DN1114_c1_g1_i3.p1 TRINITY_DN1114_c1_g1~~TRINITY_DN1114_c1_g1_i3.p1  ORF type:complete len:107 (+),score=9.42 TRINITY_DN1114_c1_g1_i3:20-340(+)